jgi:hypothetical protein
MGMHGSEARCTAQGSALQLTPGCTPCAARSSADLIDYTAEEAVRVLGEGKLLNSDSFPGHQRNKLCLVSKVQTAAARTPSLLLHYNTRVCCSQHQHNPQPAVLRAVP